MADQVMNIAKGKIAQYVQNAVDGSPANAEIIAVVLEAAEADDTLNNYDNLSTLIAAAGNTEWTSPEYAREVLANPSVTVDDTANDVDLDFDDLVDPWSGPTGNDTVKLLVCYDPDTTGGDDTTIIPLTHHDFVVAPDGNALNVNTPANGFAGIS